MTIFYRIMLAGMALLAPLCAAQAATFVQAGVIDQDFSYAPDSQTSQTVSSDGGDLDHSANIFEDMILIPEPTSWAMMIGGLGLAGMQMRRRKTAVSFA